MQPKVLLIILDGYGHGPNNRGNAILRSKSPFLKQLKKTYPTTLLQASGEAVGLPKGFQGGSEVGHVTMGAGRITWQFLETINRTIKDGSFFRKKVLLRAMRHAREKNRALHLLGMISDQGVHSHIDHLFALLKMAQQQKVPRVYIHAITDGRDVPERSAETFLKKIQQHGGKVATIIGRFYAMDRDKNWHRTDTAYRLFTQGKGTHERDPLHAIHNAYKAGDPTDYYLRPMLLQPDGIIRKNDAVIFWNYRTDRSRQITQRFLKHRHNHFVCMGPYADGKAPEVTKEPIIKNNLAAVLAKHKKTQIRIAETEKYAHVTFFFNSQIHTPFRKEKRILIPSPKVKSYAQKPEMSAYGITTKVIQKLKKNPDVLIVNYANADLVGHSGNLKATIRCCEVLDACMKKIIPTARTHGYDIILTADHGNAEQMLYTNGKPCPSHTKNPVYFTLISTQHKNARLKKGGLQDIAPTMLHLLNVKKPQEMKGHSLVA